MTRVSLLIGWVFIGVGTASAQPGFVTGEELHALCSDPSQDYRCQMYVAGVVDALMGQSLPADSMGFCLQVGADTAQLADVVEQHLSANPDRRVWNAAVLIEDALRTSFPCE